MTTTNGGAVSASNEISGAGATGGNVSPPNSETGMRRMVVNDREIRQARTLTDDDI